MKKRAFIIKIVSAWMFIEISLRLFFYYQWNIPFTHPKYFLYRFYTNLQLHENYNYKSGKTNMLVLGGSTLYADTLRFFYDHANYVINFCNILEQLKINLPVNGLSLAYPANTILDCLYEYRFLNTEHFDYVLLYNGINDVRANNISTQKFDPNYRHIEYYDDLAIFERHPEINVSVLPFTIDWCLHAIIKKAMTKNYLPKENLLELRNHSGRNEFLQYGYNIKTVAVFRETLEKIKSIADKRGQKLILCSFAWYQPSNYTFEGFTKKRLDYVQSVFPTELYGEPLNVISGINKHNEVIREFAKTHSDVILIDAETFIPKEGKYFNDICHLSEEGCSLFSDSIVRALRPLQTQ